MAHSCILEFATNESLTKAENGKPIMLNKLGKWVPDNKAIHVAKNQKEKKQELQKDIMALVARQQPHC